MGELGFGGRALDGEAAVGEAADGGAHRSAGDVAVGAGRPRVRRRGSVAAAKSRAACPAACPIMWGRMCRASKRSESVNCSRCRANRVEVPNTSTCGADATEDVKSADTEIRLFQPLIVVVLY
jgi:hypothetical protein